MKKLTMGLLGVLLICGCATTPSTPRIHETKYAVQVLEVKTSMPFNQELMGDSGRIEEILNHPDTAIYEYRTLYADIGETVADDQTKTVSLPVDYEVIDGKAVPKEKEFKLGRAVEVSISDIKGENITYKIDICNRELAGHDTIKATEGVEVEMPYFTVKSLKTEMTQALGEWRGWAGLQEDQGTLFFCVRILPPAEAK